MVQRNLDSTGDWLFGHGAQDFVADEDAMVLNLKTRLREWRNDCFFNPDAGPDYQNLLDIGTKDALDLDIRRVTLQSDGIIKINNYLSKLDNSTRLLVIQMTLDTIYGTIVFSYEV